jgi:hypothetical protein
MDGWENFIWEEEIIDDFGKRNVHELNDGDVDIYIFRNSFEFEFSVEGDLLKFMIIKKNKVN